MAELRTKPTKLSVDAFVSKVADVTKRADTRALIAMMREATNCEPTMWGPSIIGFGTYAYAYASGRTGNWPIIGLSPRKQNIAVYIMPGFDEFGGLLAKLGPHSTGKSCLYIKRLADIDKATLTKIVVKSVAKMKKKAKPA